MHNVISIGLMTTNNIFRNHDIYLMFLYAKHYNYTFSFFPILKNVIKMHLFNYIALTRFCVFKMHPFFSFSSSKQCYLRHLYACQETKWNNCRVLSIFSGRGINFSYPSLNVCYHVMFITTIYPTTCGN